MIQVLIDGIDRSNMTTKRDFKVKQKIKDSTANLTIWADNTLASDLMPGVDIKIKLIREDLSEKVLFGGIAFSIDYEIPKNRKINNELRYTIKCVDYNIIPTRRTIWTEYDGMTEFTGDIVKELVTNWLSQEGITQGNIGDGIDMMQMEAGTEIVEHDTKNIAEVFDDLANISDYDWDIDYNKALHFNKPIYTVNKYETLPYKIDHTNNEYFDIQVGRTLENYANKVFIVGNLPDDNTDEPYLTLDGRIRLPSEKPVAINEMIGIGGGTGVWGVPIEDESVRTMAQAVKRADKFLSQYSSIPVNINIKTRLDVYKPGDIIVVNLPYYNINNLELAINEMEISVKTQGDVIYTLSLINSERVAARNDLYETFKKIAVALKKRNYVHTPAVIPDTAATNGAAELISQNPNLANGLIAWFDANLADKVTFHSGTAKARIINDAVTNVAILSQAILNESPEMTLIDNKPFLSFNPDLWVSGVTQRGEYLNLNDSYIARHVFVVYRDRTDLNGNTMEVGYSCPFPGTKMQGQTGATGQMLASSSGDYAMYNLYVNGLPTPGQTRITNQLVLAHASPIAGTNGEAAGTVALGKNATSTGFNSYFTGDIAEMVIYSEYLTTEEVNTITNHLMVKHNIV